MSLSRHSVDKVVDSDLTNRSFTLTSQTTDPSNDNDTAVNVNENSNNNSNSVIRPINNTNNHASGDLVLLHQIPLNSEIALVHQLASLAKNADVIFGDLMKENDDIKERVSHLNERCVSLENSVQSLNQNYKKCKAISGNGLQTPRERRSPYRSSSTDDGETNLFTSGTRPRNVQLSYDGCLLDDQLARSRYEKYRSESSHLLDLEVTMAQAGCDDNDDDDGDEDGVDFNSGSQEAATRHVGSPRDSTVKSRPTSTGDATFVPVDTTGTTFTRICAYRQSLRSASLDSLLDPKPRRRTVEEDAFAIMEPRCPSKPIQRSQTLEFEQCPAAKGRRRNKRNGDAAELEFRISRSGEELDDHDENYIDDFHHREKHASHGALSKVRDGIRGSLRNLSCLSTLDNRGRCRGRDSMKRRSKSMPNVNANRNSSSPPRPVPVITDDGLVFETVVETAASPLIGQSRETPVVMECSEPRSAFSFKFHKLRRSKSLASGKRATTAAASANASKPLSKKYKSQDLLNSRKLSVVDIDIGESGDPSPSPDVGNLSTGKKKRRSISMKIAQLWNNMQSRKSTKTTNEKYQKDSADHADPTFDYPAARAAWQPPEEPFVGLRTIDRMSCAGSLASSAPDLSLLTHDDTLCGPFPNHYLRRQDEDDVSIYSMDTEGFYTSMHADTGIPSVKPPVPQRQSSMEDRSEASLVGGGVGGRRGRSMSRSSSSSFEKIVPTTARVIVHEKRRAKSSQRTTNHNGEIKLTTAPRCTSISTQTDLENDLRQQNQFSRRLSSIPSPWSKFTTPYATLDRTTTRTVPRQDSGYGGGNSSGGNSEFLLGDTFRRKLNSLDSPEKCSKTVVLRNSSTSRSTPKSPIGAQQQQAPYVLRALRGNSRRGSVDSYNHTRCSGDSAVSSFYSVTASDVLESTSSISLVSTAVGSQTKRLSSSSSVELSLGGATTTDVDSLGLPPTETERKEGDLRERDDDSVVVDDDVILAGSTRTAVDTGYSYWSESPVMSAIDSNTRLDASSDDSGGLTDRSTESINVPQGMQLLNTFNHTLTSFKLSDKGERHRYALDDTQSGELDNAKHVTDSVSSFLGMEAIPTRTANRPFLSSLPKPYRPSFNVTTRGTPPTANSTSSFGIEIQPNGVPPPPPVTSPDYSTHCGSLPKKLKVSSTTSTRRLPDFHSLPRRISTPHFITNKTGSYLVNGRDRTIITTAVAETASIPSLPSVSSPYYVSPNILPSNNNNNNSLLKLKQIAPKTIANLTRTIHEGDSLNSSEESGKSFENDKPDETSRTYIGDLSHDVNEKDVMEVLNSIRATINDIQVEKTVVN